MNAATTLRPGLCWSEPLWLLLSLHSTSPVGHVIDFVCSNRLPQSCVGYMAPGRLCRMLAASRSLCHMHTVLARLEGMLLFIGSNLLASKTGHNVFDLHYSLIVAVNRLSCLAVAEVSRIKVCLPRDSLPCTLID